MELDNKLLISLVFHRPVLWDKNHSLHKKRPFTENHWIEISKIMNYDVHSLRRRWRYLRDQFSVECGKISEDAVISVGTKWPYFKSLLFLKGVVKPRVPRGTAGRTSQRSSSSDHAEHDILIIDSIPKSEPPDSPPIYYQDDEESGQGTSSSISSLQTSVKKPSAPDTEEQNIQLIQSYQEDENLLFFKSLLPHVNKIPPHLLLSFRNRIQTIVEEFAYPK